MSAQSVQRVDQYAMLVNDGLQLSAIHPRGCTQAFQVGDLAFEFFHEFAFQISPCGQVGDFEQCRQCVVGVPNRLSTQAILQALEQLLDSKERSNAFVQWLFKGYHSMGAFVSALVRLQDRIIAHGLWYTNSSLVQSFRRKIQESLMEQVHLGVNCSHIFIVLDHIGGFG